MRLLSVDTKHGVIITIMSIYPRYDFIITRNAFCGTWCLTHSHGHNEPTVPIIMSGCIAHA